MNRVACLAAICVLLAGCQKPTEQSAVDVDARAEIEALKLQVSLIKMDTALSKLDTLGYGNDQAVFDPQGSQSYTKMRAPVGVVLVSLDRIEPYLNGFHVFVKVGNPSTAMLHGITGEIKWGKKDDPEPAGKSFDLPDVFPPGTWRTIKLPIGPADAQSIQKIVFAPVFNQLALNRN